MTKKTLKQIKEQIKKTVSYAAHDYYGSPEKKVLARKSPSSSGGNGGGNGGGGNGGGGNGGGGNGGGGNGT